MKDEHRQLLTTLVTSTIKTDHEVADVSIRQFIQDKSKELIKTSFGKDLPKTDDTPTA